MSLKTFITVRKYTYALIIITSLILGGTIINNASAYVIDHNNHSVWVKGNYGKLEATPHTLSQSGWVYFNITPYQNIGNIDMVWGFNTSEVKPRKAEFFKPHLVHWATDHEKFFWNVSKIEFTLDDCCYGNSYNIYKRKVTYQIGYDNVTNEPITTTETVCFDSYTHNGTNYTACWTTHHSQLENRVDVSNKLNSVNYNYDNKTRWWYVTNFAVEVNKTYTGRVWIDVPITLDGISGKYDFAVKRSSDSLYDAISNHRFYLLDPWFDSSWSTKRNLHINYPCSKEFNNPSEDGYIYNGGSYVRYSDDTDIYSYVYNASEEKIYRGYFEWDVSSIPDNAVITNVAFKYHGHSNNGDAHINQMVCQPSTASAEDVYNDIGNGITYINQDGFPEVGENKEINLGSNAVSDLQNALSSDWFAIGIQEDETIDGKYSVIYSEEYSDANPKPTLYVEYTISLNHYQMNLNLSYSDIPEAQLDFDDIRFVNISDGASLPYWIEDKVDGEWCNVWVNVTSSLHVGWNNDTVALYYGKADAVDDGDIGATFIFGDDAESGAYSDKWTDIDGVGEYSTDEAYRGTHCIKFGGTTGQTAVSKNINVTDAVFEAMSMAVGTNKQYTYLCARQSQTEKTGYYFRPNDGGHAQLYKYIADSSTQLDSDASSDDITTWHKRTIICSGTSIKTFFDDVLRNEVTNNDIISGGIGERGSSFSNQYFDEVRIRKYVANPPIYVLGDAESYTPPPITPPITPPYTEIDLIDQSHHEYTHIECATMHIPIYAGLNYISIPLYQYNTTLAALFGNHPVTNDTIKKYVNGTWNVSTYNNSTWVNASNIKPIEPTIGYEYNRTGDNFTLNVSGFMKYNITTFNYENHIGTNIIRPMRSDKDD